MPRPAGDGDAKRGVAEGIVCVADVQTKGKGYIIIQSFLFLTRSIFHIYVLFGTEDKRVLVMAYCAENRGEIAAYKCA